MAEQEGAARGRCADHHGQIRRPADGGVREDQPAAKGAGTARRLRGSAHRVRGDPRLPRGQIRGTGRRRELHARRSGRARVGAPAHSHSRHVHSEPELHAAGVLTHAGRHVSGAVRDTVLPAVACDGQGHPRGQAPRDLEAAAVAPGAGPRPLPGGRGAHVGRLHVVPDGRLHVLHASARVRLAARIRGARAFPKAGRVVRAPLAGRGVRARA
mmetsp:Transcript_12656/g.53208  ORF Transcript_12656/g.53208 Transcript_12656/m.53208 type:complete len:213 (-) Transcript_12656:431-1069(-)